MKLKRIIKWLDGWRRKRRLREIKVKRLYHYLQKYMHDQVVKSFENLNDNLPDARVYAVTLTVELDEDITKDLWENKD